MRRRTQIQAVVAIALSVTAACAAWLTLTSRAAAASPSVAAPASDPFYTSPEPLSYSRHGDILRQRQITVKMAGLSTVKATQVLYRTTNQLGAADATVATILQPLVPSAKTKLLSYQTAYDGLAGTCRPSYTIQGGTSPSSTAALELTLMMSYVAQGYTVVTSDYEGSEDGYGAGRQAGDQTLDAILATERVLGLSTTTPVAMVGYSGGSIATMWAAQEAPTYTPELNLIGAAAGGIPVDFAHNLSYIDGSSDWAGAEPAVGLGLLRAYGLNPADYLSPLGLQDTAAAAQGCLVPTADPGLKFSQLLAPQYQDYDQTPTFAKIFNDSIMGRGATPKEPLLMDVGNKDGTGDGVMVAKDVQELAYEYCQRGVNVQFHIFNGDNHIAALVPFVTQALTFLGSLYAGQTPQSGCAQVTPGNPLTPLAVPATSTPSGPKLTLAASAKGKRLAVRLKVSRGSLTGVTLTVRRGGKRLLRRTVGRVGTKARTVTLPVTVGTPGVYRVTATAHGRTLATATLHAAA